jgi:hypothetical protein
METPEVVIAPSSKEAIEAQAAAQPAPAENQTVDEQKPVEAEGSTEQKQDEAQSASDDNSVIRQMRKQLRQQQKEIAALRQAQIQTAQPDPKPSRDNFQTDADYIQAEVAYQMKQAQAATPRSEGIFETKFAETRKTHADFEQALEDIDHVAFTPEAQVSLRQAVETLQHGGEILYHIAKNPDLAEELALLPPAAFAARLGDIHGDIRQAKNAKTVSKAPAPITPVSGAPAKIDKSYDDITDQAEFLARRRAEKAAWRKAKYGL